MLKDRLIETSLTGETMRRAASETNAENSNNSREEEEEGYKIALVPFVNWGRLDGLEPQTLYNEEVHLVKKLILRNAP